MRLLLLAAAIVWGFTAELAHACSGGPCLSPRVVPGMGSVPLDQFKLKFWPGRDAAKSTMGGSARLYAVANGARTEVALRSETMTSDGSVVLTPSSALTAGTQLVLEADAADCSGGKDLSASFTVTSAAPIPPVFGKLESTVHRSMLEVATIAGSCSVNVDAAWVDLVLTLGDAAKPLADVIVYRLVLDGKQQTSFTNSLVDAEPLPRGHERVYAACKADDKLVGSVALGKHSARLRGELPSGAVIESDEIVFELNCEALPPSAAGAGGDSGAARPSGGVAGSQAGTSTAGSKVDTSAAGSEHAAAGSTHEAAGRLATTPTAAGASAPKGESAGGCSAGHGSSGWRGVWALVSIVAWGRRRRRPVRDEH